MTERRRWKGEEKLAIIKEVKENNKVVETCRRYSVDPGMYYKWKENLKELLAERDLENALLSKSISMKKNGEKTMKLADKYIAKGLGVSDIANILHIPRCSFL